MIVEVYDAKFEKKLKSFLVKGPVTPAGSAIYNIGPTVMVPDVENEEIKLYGIDAIGSSTLYSFISLKAKIEEPSEVFVSDIVPLYESLGEFGFKCKMEIDDEGYRLSDEKFTLESKFDYGEIPTNLETFKNRFNPPKFGDDTKFVPIIKTTGGDLYRLQSMNRKTLRQEVYMISPGIIGTDSVSVSTEAIGEFEPFNIYGLDPIFVALKDGGEVTISKPAEKNVLLFESDFAKYMYLYEVED